jgi:hypothetical protein
MKSHRGGGGSGEENVKFFRVRFFFCFFFVKIAPPFVS